MQIRFLDIAQFELDESVEYYNSELAGLGDEFLIEVLHALERIKHFSYFLINSAPAINPASC